MSFYKKKIQKFTNLKKIVWKNISNIYMNLKLKDIDINLPKEKINKKKNIVLI